jgi:hypothetical protein
MLDIDRRETEIGKLDPQSNMSKKREPTTEQDTNGREVAGSNVVLALKYEFTTHTKENKNFGKRATRKQSPRKMREQTIQPTLQNHHPSSPSSSQGDVSTRMYCYSLNDSSL